MLNQQQSRFLEVLFSHNNQDGEFERAGLEIYQNSLVANAARALAITFSTVHSYIGKVAFNRLVENYLKAEMKKEYDWGEFGASFSQFISIQNMPNAVLLSSAAALDFACHKAERSQNIAADLSTLNLLSERDAYELFFTLCSGMQLLTTSMPIDEVNNTINQLTQEEKITQLDDVTPILSSFTHQHLQDDNNKKEPFYFVIWRPDFQAHYARITHAEYQWLNLILGNKQTKKLSIGQALDEINPEHFSFVEWLPKAIEERFINGIYYDTSLA